MGYRIKYAQIEKNGARVNVFRVIGFAVGFLILFVSLVNRSWPEGRALLESIIGSPEEVLAVAGMEEMAGKLHAGGSWGMAVRELVRNWVQSLCG